jgi:hypothetical protein
MAALADDGRGVLAVPPVELIESHESRRGRTEGGPWARESLKGDKCHCIGGALVRQQSGSAPPGTGGGLE